MNPHERSLCRSFWDLFLWWLGYYDDPEPLLPPPADFSYPNPQAPVDREEPRVTFINHSTFLVTIDGVSFLTDPIWNGRCSPLPLVGPRRKMEPPFPIEELPSLDYILISHDHYDHLDDKTVRKLAAMQPDMTWFVPLGLGCWLRKRGIERVVELDWWEGHQAREETAFTPGVEVFAVPSQHYSGRGFFDKNRTLWAGYVVKLHREGKPEKTFYFAGDTGYNPCDFKGIGRLFGGFDLSLIPIGVYTPRKFMKPVHVCPEEAVQIHSEVDSKLSIGSHWGTFRLSHEGLYQPPYDLYRAMEEQNLNHKDFRVLDAGQTINW